MQSADTLSAPIYDGPWKLFGWDKETGASRWVLHQDGKMVFRTDTPVQNIIETNKEAALDASGKRWGEWTRVASVPINEFHHSGLSEALKQQDKGWVSRYLNDSDRRAWRTREGRV